jgi:hypothetical protein
VTAASTRHGRGWALPMAGLALVWLGGCGSPPPPAPPAPPPAPVVEAPPEPAAPTKEKVESGLACAVGEAECDGGYCAVVIPGNCEQPITCELAIVANCKANTTLVEAKARARGTFPAKTEGKLTAAANCTEGEVIRTAVQELKCR